MKVPRVRRPYIPLSVRVQVAERQLVQHPPIFNFGLMPSKSMRAKLTWLLNILFGTKQYELHHRPALINRHWNERKKDYWPPANDPAHLVYLLKEDHRVETLIRGVGAQRSDVAQRRYLGNVAKNRDPKRRRKAKIPSRKKPWPKARKLRS